MVRIAGVDIPDKKRLHIALTYLYGIGRSNVQILLKKAQIAGVKTGNQLTEKDIAKIQKVIDEEFKVEGDLRGEVAENIKRLREIGSYKGLRHVRNLPVRGQRTRSNARTKRGKRKTVGALRKEIRAKLEQSAPTSSQTVEKTE